MTATDRGLSTAVDVCVCLLLVSASVVTLVSTAPPPSDDGGDNAARRAATLLGASTGRVVHRSAADGETGTPVARSTVAGLLAEAALASARGDSADFVRAVEREVDRTLRPVDADVHVAARLFPSADASVTPADRITVGDPPPAATSVDAVTFVVLVRNAAPGGTARAAVATSAPPRSLDRVRITVRAWSA